jgi:hypothetical protein
VLLYIKVSHFVNKIQIKFKLNAGDGRELKCYYCVDKCHYPLEVHKCSDDKYMCFSSFTTIGEYARAFLFPFLVVHFRW